MRLVLVSVMVNQVVTLMVLFQPKELCEPADQPQDGPLTEGKTTQRVLVGSGH